MRDGWMDGSVPMDRIGLEINNEDGRRGGEKEIALAFHVPRSKAAAFAFMSKSVNDEDESKSLRASTHGPSYCSLPQIFIFLFLFFVFFFFFFF